MKIFKLILSLIAGITIGARLIDQFPEAEISNGAVHARLYLPDTANGYYRGVRFDWSGVIPSLQYENHSYFGQWFEKYSPTMHDAITGPVEDFAPVGYDEAQVGETFVKIGIGTLTKPEEPKYFFVNPYKLVNCGVWQIKRKSDKVEFIHKLNDEKYAYEYEKTVQLTKGKPQLVLLHSLKNTGKQRIETEVYNHNFFQIDKQPIGTDYVVRFPFNLSAEAGSSEFGKLQDNAIRYTKNLSGKDHLYFPALAGFSNNAKDYDIRIENQKTGAGVRITSDQPISRMAFWSAHLTICPEPYIKIKVNPGETFRWKIYYDFYTTKNNN